MKSQEHFLSLIHDYRGILYKVSKVYMDNNEDREDLIQEMIYQLWKSFGSFNNQSQFATWMYRVCLNTALTFFKRSKKVIQGIEIDNDTMFVYDEESEDEDLQLQLFYKAVQELSRVEKALIFLFLEGQSHKEIAVSLGISEINARVRLKRTKDKIQIIIKKYGYEF